MTASGQYASVRYPAGDVQATTGFCTTHPGFTPNTSAVPAFAGVARGPLRLLLSRPASSGAPATPARAGRDRIRLAAGGLDAEITRRRDAGRAFRGDVIAGRGRRQILLTGPAGNPIELFQPAHRPASPEEAS